MKKSDVSTIVGLIAATLLLVWGMSSGSSLMIFWDTASVAITLGASFCALLITYSIDDIKKLGKLVVESFRLRTDSNSDIISKFTNLSKKARREGLLSLEDEVNEIEDEFIKKGLQMVIDGIEPETIKEILELDIAEMDARHGKGAGIFQTWGVYLPAFGMVGTLIGLIQMLQNLTDTTTIASGMGKALITTFYGALAANLFCLPIAANLKEKNKQEISIREMVLEGILAIQSGVNPRVVEEKLMTYLSPSEKVEYLKNSTENNEGVVG